MKIIVGIYMLCVATAVLVFAIFPAEDTYISPVEVRPVETRVVETRLVEQAAPNANLSQEIEITVQEITNVEGRITAIEQRESQTARDIGQKIAEEADKSATRADAIEDRLTAAEGDIAKERSSRSGVDIMLAIIAGVITAFSIITAIVARDFRIRWRSGPLNPHPAPKSRHESDGRGG